MNVPDWEDIDEVMTNFDNTIKEGAEEKLRSGQFVGTYHAWNFFGLVWFQDGLFHCQVMRYRSVCETVSKESLKEIMDYCCDKYGSY
jgi:hypothetical protein